MEAKDDDGNNAIPSITPPPKKAVSFRAIRDADIDDDGGGGGANQNDTTNNFLTNRQHAASLPPRCIPPVTAAAAAIVPSPRPQLTRSQNFRHIDISTGQATRRQQTIQTVDPRHREARSKWTKVTSRFLKNTIHHKEKKISATLDQVPSLEEKHQAQEENDDEEKSNAASPTIVPQYRIRSRVVHDEDGDDVLMLGGGKKKRRKRSWFQHWWKSSSLDGRPEMAASAITDLLMWSYQAYFFQVVMAIALISMVITILFALLIYLDVYFEPSCINVGGEDFGFTFKRSFMDAYQLSWTTLVTTGYGLVAPQNPTAEKRCFGINMLMALESFVGVLFAGITGAIVFAKIARYQSIALVLFSQPICVRYGTGVTNDTPVLDDDCGSEIDGDSHCHFPFPILEFRIINQLATEKGGEIMNASVSVVASVLQHDEESDHAQLNVREKSTSSSGISNMVGQAAALTTDAATKAAATVSKAGLTVGKAGLSVGMAGTQAAKTTGKALFGAAARTTQLTGNFIQQLNKTLTGSPHTMSMHEMDERAEAEPYNKKEIQEIERELEKAFEERFAEKLKQEQAMLAPVSTLRATATSIAVSEGNSKLAPPRVYHKLEIETDSHPFFKRVWNIRHVLNEESPLLTRKARNMIIENNGHWPQSLNSWQGIRQHLRFNDIIVSFSGIANASGTSVSAQKVYNYVSVNIGYTFVNLLVHENGVLGVDQVLLNDVREQIGGGGEPLEVAKASTYAEAATKIAEGVAEATKTAAEATKSAAEEIATTAAGVISDTTKPIATGISEAVTKTGDAMRAMNHKYDGTENTESPP